MMSRLIIFGLFLVMISCSHDKSMEIDIAMNNYDRLITEMDADSIANLYTEDGELGKDAIGRESIRAFLKSFKDVQVLNSRSLTKSFVFRGDTVQCEGTYTQNVIVKNDTLNLKGEYWVTWAQVDEKWLIKRMITKPE